MATMPSSRPSASDFFNGLLVSVALRLNIEAMVCQTAISTLERIIRRGPDMDLREEKFRPLAGSEEIILRALLERDFPGHSELLQQLRGLQAKRVDAEGSLQFLVASDVRASVNRGVVVEARYADADTQGESGAHVNILLHVNEGKLSILEFYKDDGSMILQAPRVEVLQFFS